MERHRAGVTISSSATADAAMDLLNDLQGCGDKSVFMNRSIP